MHHNESINTHGSAILPADLPSTETLIMSITTARDNEWTFVSHKRPGKSQSNKKNLHKTASVKYFLNSPEELAKVNAMPIQQTDIQKMLATINNFRGKWSQSVQGQLMKELLVQQFRGRRVIGNAIVTGLGSFHPAARNDPYRGCWQLAVFLETVKVLVSLYTDPSNGPEGASAPMYAQDPVFTFFDKALLQEVDIIVLPGSEAVENCIDSTFLFVPFVGANAIFYNILPGRSPLLYIGSDIEDIMDKFGLDNLAKISDDRQSLANQSRLVGRSFLERRQRLAVDFNGLGETALYGMAAFVRQDNDDDEAEDAVAIDAG